MAKPSLRTLGIVAAVAAVALVASIWGAHWFIRAVYQGDLLPGLLENRADKPLDYYIETVDRIVLSAFLLVALLASAWYLARYRSALLVGSVLLAGDVIFCILSETYGGVLDVRLDRGIPELFQYGKEIGIAVLLLRLYRGTGRRIFAGWGVLFAFIFVDDAFKYHEHAGRVLAAVPGLDAIAGAIGVRAVDIGEMASLAPVLLALLAFLAVPYFRENAEGRRLVHRMGALLAALIGMGGAMDLIDRIAVTHNSDLVQLLSLIEDGGEMVVMSAILVYTLTIWWRMGRGHQQHEPARI